MAATFVARVSATTASSTDNITTAAFTTSGTNRAIAVCAAIRTSVRRLTTIARGGSDTFTDSGTDKQVPAQTCAADLWWSSNEPVTDSTSLTATIDSAVTIWGINVVVLSGVDQTTRFINAVANSDVAVAGGLDDLTIDSDAVGNLVIDFFSVLGNTGTVAADGSQTDRGGFSAGTAGDEIDSNVSTLPGTGSNVSMGWSGFADATHIAHIGFVAVSGDTAPVVTVPTGYIPTNNLGPRTISGISVTEGTSPITLVTLTCTLGKGTMTMTASGASAISGNGTNAISIIGGSETDINNTLATFAFTGLEPTRENVTVAVLATDGTLNDSENLVLFNHRTSLTIVANSYADLVAMIQTAKMILPLGSTTGDVEIVATDDDTRTDTQTITLNLITAATGFGINLVLRRRRKKKSGN